MTKTDEATQPNCSTPSKNDNDLYEVLGKIVDACVRIGGIPFIVVGRILDNFIDFERPGIKVLGAFSLFFGVVFSADGFYQMFSRPALFPWWEDRWVGWVGWLVVWFQLQFWCALGISLIVQWVESLAIRGKTPQEAKNAYEQYKEHDLPDKSKKKIDLVNALRYDYKRAGMGERNLLGLIVLIIFLADFASVFIVGRNPWGRPPLEFVSIIIYNVFTLFAGEAGFVLWRRAHGKY